jgi:hypothetical protein
MITIRKLIKEDQDNIKPLFSSKKYMGNNVSSTYFFEKDQMAELYWNGFCNTYLQDLKSYHAFGAFNNNELVGAISCYQSPDEPSWYGTQIRSNGDSNIAKALLDHMIEFNEKDGRLKFYTLWNAKHVKLLRRFIFSKNTKERYDYFDEYIVPDKFKCYYTNHWHILFNRVLLPSDTIVRCTFLKQKYRTILPIGGNI